MALAFVAAAAAAGSPAVQHSIVGLLFVRAADYRPGFAGHFFCGGGFQNRRFFGGGGFWHFCGGGGFLFFCGGGIFRVFFTT